MSQSLPDRLAGTPWPYAMMLTASFILASNHILARWIQADAPPAAMTFGRITIGALILLPVAWKGLRDHREFLLREWRLMLGLAIGLILFGNAGVYLAYNFTTALNGSVISTAQPAVTVLLSLLLFGERARWLQIAGIGIAASGVLVILSEGDPAVLASLRWNIGDLIMLAAMIGFAFHNTSLRRLPREMGPLTVLLAVQISGIVVLLPFVVAEALFWRTVSFNAVTVGAMLWIGTFVAIGAVGCMNTAVRALGANTASMANYMRALLTAAMAIALLGEELHPFHFFAFVLVVSGIVMMGRGRNRASGPAQKPDEHVAGMAPLDPAPVEERPPDAGPGAAEPREGRGQAPPP